MTARGREKVFGSSMQTFSRLDATEMASKLSAGGGSLFISRAGMSAHGPEADFSTRNIRLHQLGQREERLLPAEVAHFRRDHVGDAFLHDRQLGAT